MSFDTRLAERIRRHLGKKAGLTEMKMFGGVGFLIKGNLCCGVHGSEMIVRVKPEQTAEILKQPHTRMFNFSGRPMAGWILVGPLALTTEQALARWVRAAVRFGETMQGR